MTQTLYPKTPVVVVCVCSPAETQRLTQSRMTFFHVQLFSCINMNTCVCSAPRHSDSSMPASGIKKTLLLIPQYTGINCGVHIILVCRTYTYINDHQQYKIKEAKWNLPMLPWLN